MFLMLEGMPEEAFECNMQSLVFISQCCFLIGRSSSCLYLKFSAGCFTQIDRLQVPEQCSVFFVKQVTSNVFFEHIAVLK